jgi:hypothetical protein
MDLAHLIGATGIIQDALGRRRLAGIDVGHDADISDLSKWDNTGHFFKDLLRTTVFCLEFTYQR